jgi:nucleotide-binding universal stress UspA family protein
MYTKLAVPLDGTPLAEQALPYAIRLAALLKAHLLLLRVAEFKALPGMEFEQETEFVDQIESYLKKVKQQITTPATQPYLPAERVEVLAAYGKPAPELVTLATRTRADLIVMTTHARSGLPRLVLGSIASEIIKHATIPVILLRPAETGTFETLNLSEPVSFGRRIGPVLVALDGSSHAEAALDPAITLACEIGSALHLLEVVVPKVPVQFGPEFGPGYVYESYETEKDLTAQGEEADHYLEKVQKYVRGQGLICIRNVQQGDPASVIIDYARQIQASLIVMATHARGRIGQVLLGSVAAEVVRQSHLPVMMVRFKEEFKTPIPAGA